MLPPDVCPLLLRVKAYRLRERRGPIYASIAALFEKGYGIQHLVDKT